ncbi:E1 DerP2 DerF2 domain containing protein [Trichuris trichiura]|uniref:E1 DerP2 DerF2 domain containing protein n=1 Tax=Trichuris trichiura TaxID=36087 RepID=A0A077Z4A0_TRITR|nr:E1 DerP2 DerF2 domain containing protein [Trichuris trichiura]
MKVWQPHRGANYPAGTTEYLRKRISGGPDSTVRVDHLQAEPSPLEVPGILRLTLRVNISVPPPEEVYVKLFLRKRIADTRWVRIPCIFGFGSCDYAHLPVCLLTHELFGCPIKASYYSIDETFLLKNPETSLSRLLQQVWAKRANQ